MHRVAEVRRLDHVVLLVAAQPVLRTESRGDVEPANGAQRVERMLEVRRHGCRMRQQRDAPAFQLTQQFHVAQQAVDSKLDHESPFKENARRSFELDHKTVRVVEIGLLRRMFERPV